MRIATVAVAAFLTLPLAATAAAAAPPSSTEWEVSVVDSDQSFRGLAIGPGAASRVYRTTDGGQTWEETFRNEEEAAFFNCIDFAPGDRLGLGVSDPVDGKFRIIRTTDGGASWEVLPDAGMPDSSGEVNFSASGDCLSMTGHDAWFGVGGEDARVYHSDDRGMTWAASDAALPSGEAAGVFALDFANPRQGIAVGGHFADPTTGASSTSEDGQQWDGAGELTHLGEDVAWTNRGRATALAVGEGGGCRWHEPHPRRRPDVAADQRRGIPHARLRAVGGVLGCWW